MSCDCSKYTPIELDRGSIDLRIKQSPSIRKHLSEIARNEELRLGLFQCVECGQFWQSGWEWNFDGKEYLFQVPPIEISDWQNEPYQQPAAMMIYSAVMRDLFARSKFEAGNSPCRVEGCGRFALKTSVFCRDHHIESIQKRGRLPKKPFGRMFPPYFVESTDNIE